jgi:site-specific recombinase XerD
LLDYFEELVCERELSKRYVESLLRTNLALCRRLVDEGHGSFAQLRVEHLDEVVSSLVCAPRDDLLRRRRQVQQHNSKLRGFLRYLHQRDLLERDLARALISPPCWRASKPPAILTEEQVQNVLESVNRGETWGRRCYAMLLLLTTYGLRPIDVARLRLDDLHWREQSIGLVQKKTGCVVTLPLLPEVSAALYDYLRQDRVPGLRHRHLFVSLSWPHRPVLGRTVADVVAKALRAAGMPWARARHLRASVATHLLRQGEALSTIQEVLGHRAVETTQRYAVTDVEILRQVLEERER